MSHVLVVTSVADTHADYLTKKFIEKGITTIRINTDEFSRRLSVRYTTNNGHLITTVREDGNPFLFSPENITSVWYRKPLLSKFDCIGQKETMAFIGREIESYLTDLIYCLGNTKWVNHPRANKIADNKLRQLRLAKEIGFRIPETLVTNDFEEANNFARRFSQQGIVYKTLSNPFISETTSTFRSVFTSKV